MPTDQELLRLHTGNDLTAAPFRQVCYIRLWCFAEQCLMPKLQNKAMHSVITCLKIYRIGVESIRVLRELECGGSRVHEAVMIELANDCAEGEYADSEMDELGAIPGTLKEVTERVRNREPNLSGMSGYENDRFMVSEDVL